MSHKTILEHACLDAGLFADGMDPQTIRIYRTSDVIFENGDLIVPIGVEAVFTGPFYQADIFACRAAAARLREKANDGQQHACTPEQLRGFARHYEDHATRLQRLNDGLGPDFNAGTTSEKHNG